MTTKTFKTIGITIVCICIAIVGYLIFQEATTVTQEEIAQPEPVVTAVNDSTYHINLSDKCCLTLERNCDTLNIYSTGAMEIIASRDTVNDTIEVVEYLGKNVIPHTKTYTVTYHDFFKDAIGHISFK